MLNYPYILTSCQLLNRLFLLLNCKLLFCLTLALDSSIKSTLTVQQYLLQFLADLISRVTAFIQSLFVNAHNLSFNVMLAHQLDILVLHLKALI